MIPQPAGVRSPYPASGPVAGLVPGPWRLRPAAVVGRNRWTAVPPGPLLAPRLSAPLSAPLRTAPPAFPDRSPRPRGPGIKGGGSPPSAPGSVWSLTIVVAVGFAIGTEANIDTRNPWFMLISQLGLWVGFVGAGVVASRRHGTGSLATDFGLAWPTLARHRARRGGVGSRRVSRPRRHPAPSWSPSTACDLRIDARQMTGSPRRHSRLDRLAPCSWWGRPRAWRNSSSGA